MSVLAEAMAHANSHILEASQLDMKLAKGGVLLGRCVGSGSHLSGVSLSAVRWWTAWG